MNMTKRDIVDIVLVWVAISFLPALLTGLVTLGVYIGMSDEASKYTEKLTAVTFQFLYIAALLFLNYLLLFKRSRILSLVIPDGREREVSILPGLTVLASYAFWIRLLGIFTFLSSGIHFLGRLTMDMAAKRESVAILFWYRSGDKLVSAVLAVIVIWKADWIAGKLENLGSSKAPDATSGSAPGADPSVRQG